MNIPSKKQQKEAAPLKSHEPRINQMPHSLTINFNKQRLQRPPNSKNEDLSSAFIDRNAVIGEEGRASLPHKIGNTVRAKRTKNIKRLKNLNSNKKLNRDSPMFKPSSKDEERSGNDFETNAFDFNC